MSFLSMDPGRKAAIATMYNAGYTVREVGETFGISGARVQQILNDVEGKPATPRFKHFSEQTKQARREKKEARKARLQMIRERLRQLREESPEEIFRKNRDRAIVEMYEAGRTHDEIADAFNLSYQRIAQIIAKARSSEASEPHHVSRQRAERTALANAKREAARQRRNARALLREERDLEILRMRANGTPLRDIARALNVTGATVVKITSARLAGFTSYNKHRMAKRRAKELSAKKPDTQLDRIAKEAIAGWRGYENGNGGSRHAAKSATLVGERKEAKL